MTLTRGEMFRSRPDVQKESVCVWRGWRDSCMKDVWMEV